MHFCNMFKKLQAKWNVNGWNLLLIIATFAIGGSICGFLGRKLLLLSGLQKNFGWLLLYIILVTILWPFCVMMVSFPLGQFAFFRKYIAKILARVTLKRNFDARITPDTKIAIFASGAGSNAQKIIEHFRMKAGVKIELVVCNKPGAGVIKIAQDHNIECLLVNKEFPLNSESFVAALKERGIDFIILAGFLSKIPQALILAFPKKIINIHPALLPAYGGKGMYGMFVHEAVIAHKEKQSGISIHYVDELYDHGEIIYQATYDILPNDTAETLAEMIHRLEHKHYPTVIENIVKKQKTS